jgi:epoxide hydrolase-like predicted phosphatase
MRRIRDDHTGANLSVKAVIFDLGGVVFDSPLAFIRDYEVRHGLPENIVARVVGGYGGEQGAWQRLERGELMLPEFCEHMDRDAAAMGAVMSTADLMLRMAELHAVRPVMLAAIRKLRDAGLKVGALTNNWVTHDGYDEQMRPLREEFHAFVESCKVGLRKPDPRIYAIACERLAVSPSASVFLDDIGGNLKVARSLGMTTIKVGEPEAALRELGQLVGIDLLSS